MRLFQNPLFFIPSEGMKYKASVSIYFEMYYGNTKVGDTIFASN